MKRIALLLLVASVAITWSVTATADEPCAPGAGSTATTGSTTVISRRRVPPPTPEAARETRVGTVVGSGQGSPLPAPAPAADVIIVEDTTARPAPAPRASMPGVTPQPGETVIISRRPVSGPQGAGVVVGTDTVIVEEAMPSDPAESLLRDAAADARIEAEKLRTYVQNALANGRSALQNGDIDGARDWYRRVLEVDPTNEAARAALSDLVDDRSSTVGEYLDRSKSVESIRRQEASAKVNSYLDRGRTFEAREDFDAAVKEYQKALSIISWYTDQRDFGVTADSIRDLIENAKYKAEVAERMARQDQIRAAQVEREQELISERERQMGKIRAYFEEANRAFSRGEYELAREYARQILKLDPQNPDADQLVCISYNAQYLQEEDRARRLFDDQWKSVMKDLEYSTLPQVKTVVFPDDWLEGIAQRQPRVVGDVGGPDDASLAAIMATLESKRVKGLNWEGANLDQVVSYLRTITGLNFFVTPAVRADVFDSVEVNLELDDVAVNTVLDLICEPAGLMWEPRNGVVVIATKDEVRGDMLLRYFDVKDLNVAIQNFVGQEINLVPSNFTPPEPPELPEPMPIFPAEGLVDLIRETIGGESAWEDPASIEAKNGIIIARNTSPILEEVGMLLDELRANSGILVNLEVRFLTAEDNFLRDVGVDLRGLGDNSQGIGMPGLGTGETQDDLFHGSPANPYGVPFGIFPEPSSAGTANDSGIFYGDGQDGAYAARVENLYDITLGNPEVLTGSGGLSFQHVYLDDTEIEVILRAVEKSERLQQVTASRITVYNTQRANVSVLNQVSYVQDYEVEIAQASNIANPVIQTIQDGVVLDVRPVVSNDRRFVTLELRPTVAILTRPIATFSTSLASGPVTAAAPVVIQIPELQVSRVRTTVVMPDGGTLLLGGLKFYEEVSENTGVPFLSCIPVVNFFFSRRGTYINRRNLLVLIKAEIVQLDEMEPRDDLDVPSAPVSDWVPMRTPVIEDVCNPSAPPPCPQPPSCACPPQPQCGPAAFEAPPVVRTR